jgi:hypothetical protein
LISPIFNRTTLSAPATRMRASADALSSHASAAQDAFLDYFRCPVQIASVLAPRKLSGDSGYFTYGGAVCYGRLSGGPLVRHASNRLADVAAAAQVRSGRLELPFDLAEVATNLRQERYRPEPPSWFETLLGGAAARNVYYLLRPFLSVAIRKHLQRLRLKGWERIVFPKWPVDDSVDQIMRITMELLLKRGGIAEIPFIWFWPDGAPACAMMTHDVEGHVGRSFCNHLADLDDSFGIRSAFQMIPGDPIERPIVDDLRQRGFEVNLHDLEHNGSLFRDRASFHRRVVEINGFARQFGCRGFRSGAMYREQAWFGAFEFSYDMSVPNAAHLEPQRGGCCTVMPYFNGDLLELPLTTTQDYSLFHILGEYSVQRWQQQTEMLLSRNGLISFIAHPDYLARKRAEAVYVDLLAHLCRLRTERGLWIALPGQVNDWWRARRRMTLVRQGSSWRIEGPDSERARIAYATLEGGHVVFRVANAGTMASS